MVTNGEKGFGNNSIIIKFSPKAPSFFLNLINLTIFKNYSFMTNCVKFISKELLQAGTTSNRVIQHEDSLNNITIQFNLIDKSDISKIEFQGDVIVVHNKNKTDKFVLSYRQYDDKKLYI